MSNFFAKNRSMRGYDWWSESPSQKVRLDNGLSLCTGRGSHPILFVVVLPEARSFVTFLSDIQSMSVSASLSGYECSDVTSRFESRSEFRLHQQKIMSKGTALPTAFNTWNLLLHGVQDKGFSSCVIASQNRAYHSR